MDSQFLTVLIAVTCLAAGVLVCWLVMRGRTSSSGPQATPALQNELAQANERGRLLEEGRRVAVADYEVLKLQAEQWREALSTSQKEHVRLTERAAQVPGLEARLNKLQDQQKADQAAAASQNKPKLQVELADAKKRTRLLEDEKKVVVADYERLKLQANQWCEALELAKKEQSRLAGQAAEVSTLEARLLKLQDLEQADHAAAAQIKQQAQTEIAQAQERNRLLEVERQLALEKAEGLQRQAAQLRETLEAAQKEQARLAEQTAQLPALEARVASLQANEKASQQALLRRATDDAENAEALKRTADRLAALEEENTALKHAAASVAALLEEQQHEKTNTTTPALTQLPVLEERVAALQTLAKAIQQEFQLFAELQRTFTLTSTTVQDFSDAAEAKEAASAVS
ncbi:MAG: tolA protein [Polaromonas sp.]|nr:tolA protein [Polaromonas sp.]